MQDTNELPVSGAQCELADFALFLSVERGVLKRLLRNCPVRELQAGQILIAAGVLNLDSSVQDTGTIATC